MESKKAILDLNRERDAFSHLNSRHKALALYSWVITLVAFVGWLLAWGWMPR